MATTLKRLVRAVGKRAFTFVMGKLNVAKMANFMEVDVFVLVASPENSLIDTRVRRANAPSLGRLAYAKLVQNPTHRILSSPW